MTGEFYDDQAAQYYCPERIRMTNMGSEPLSIASAACDRACQNPGGIPGGERKWYNPLRGVLGDTIYVCGHDVPPADVDNPLQTA